MVLKITKSAYHLIKKESLICKTETGGLLIGTLRLPIVIKASEAGSLAKVSTVSYSNDAVFDNKKLHTAIEKYGGRVKFVGYWHKHPGSMSQLSAMDIETARGIVERTEKEGDRRPVFFMITNVTCDNVKLYCYMLSDHYRIVPVTTELIDDNSPEVVKALSIEPAIIQPKKMDFWNDLDFQFYLTKNGCVRLRQEVDDLKGHGFSVKAYAKGYVYLTIANRKETLTCVLPTEYPLNPPRFFRGKKELDYSLPIWNSSFGIIDIVQNMSKQLRVERRMHESNNIQTGSRWVVFLDKVKKIVEYLWCAKGKRKTDVHPEHR